MLLRYSVRSPSKELSRCARNGEGKGVTHCGCIHLYLPPTETIRLLTGALWSRNVRWTATRYIISPVYTKYPTR